MDNKNVRIGTGRPDTASGLEELQARSIVYTDEETKDYYRFIEQVRKKSGIDLALYKEAQMRRRLNTLRVKNGYATFDAFFRSMDADKQLFYEFLDRMTINVSEFWRNPNRWQTLRERVLPYLSAQNRSLRCWSAACSTGEEPYTLAMILDDARLLNTTTMIASDIDDNALAKAKEALYMERALKDVPTSFQDTYFHKEEEMYRVQDKLKRSITFRKQNLLSDTFDGGYDLIICRNVMIYFTEEAKHELYHKFSKALRPGGVLFVGSTEQIFNPAQYEFETMETFFYRKAKSTV
ncbi:protein-glutamate O-methyltransferase CheR [Paenibacillus sp. ACRRX]|uniref:CheR family methyltransferase n=1 Tax=unclassified Paenibacillus TaxID=185978 RepID=UPI001EF51131|nr:MULTISPECIES: protein-glutamate O-methyltransferase CheR [unclassified Paenibacillus]MCG7406453.1 protein-glutamate O-methyltransferase CheR [Paenibacillus sp. ACRRX]MDK8179485.1 protein-glutamate O-methyltransferase CheR [Paenibacillus sp. UMB4589-SE434]